LGLTVERRTRDNAAKVMVLARIVATVLLGKTTPFLKLAANYAESLPKMKIANWKFSF
jgi:hypothetical protein